MFTQLPLDKKNEWAHVVCDEGCYVFVFTTCIAPCLYSVIAIKIKQTYSPPDSFPSRPVSNSFITTDNFISYSNDMDSKMILTRRLMIQKIS